MGTSVCTYYMSATTQEFSCGDSLYLSAPLIREFTRLGQSMPFVWIDVSEAWEPHREADVLASHLHSGIVS